VNWIQVAKNMVHLRDLFEHGDELSVPAKGRELLV
jgi:hypothetical protein